MCLVCIMINPVMTNFGPSEVRALPVRLCRRAAWQTLWPLLTLLFLFLSSSSPPLLFSQKGWPRAELQKLFRCLGTRCFAKKCLLNCNAINWVYKPNEDVLMLLKCLSIQAWSILTWIEIIFSIHKQIGIKSTKCAC